MDLEVPELAERHRMPHVRGAEGVGVDQDRVGHGRPMLATACEFTLAPQLPRGDTRGSMAATGERDDPAFPVGAACRIDSRSPWRQIAEIPVGLDPGGIAVDVERRRAFVACSRSDFVSVVDLEQHETIAEIPTGAEPIDIGLDEQTGRVFTADAHSDQVTIIDSATLEVETVVPVGGYPSGLTHVPETRRLYVGNSLGSTMSVIDLDTLETVATVEAEPGAGAIGVDTSRNLAVCVNFVAVSDDPATTETFEEV